MEFLYEEGLELEFTYLNEQGRVEAILSAGNKLDNGEEFAFYDLWLSNEEKILLNNVTIKEVGYKVNYLSNNKKLYEYFINELKDVLIEEDYKIKAPLLSKLMVRIVSNILAANSANDAEVMLRGEKLSSNDYCSSNNKCAYWHIDKSHGEIRQGLEEVPFPIGNAVEQKLYVISLLGATTIFYNATMEEKAEFKRLANATTFAYGHENQFNCDEDEINKLLTPSLAVRANKWQGSVHITGINGAIHSVPVDSCEDRLLLLITPIYTQRT
jgi:hypothetical protein